jgi:hypothetical protein
MFAELQASVQLTISLKDDGLFLTAYVADFIVRFSMYESRGDVLSSYVIRETERDTEPTLI